MIYSNKNIIGSFRFIITSFGLPDSPWSSMASPDSLTHILEDLYVCPKAFQLRS